MAELKRRGVAVREEPWPTLRAAVAKERVTTLAVLPGFRVTQVLGVVTSLSTDFGWTAQSKGNNALSGALVQLRENAAAEGASAIVGLQAAAFGAHGGITGGLGGDAVGIMLIGTAAAVEPITSGETDENENQRR